MTDILTGIKSIKCLSWERIFNQKIEDIRLVEHQYYKRAMSVDAGIEMF